MTATPVLVERSTAGKLHAAWYDVTLDSSYPDGGYGSANGLRLPFSKIVSAQVVGISGPTSGIAGFVWDQTNKKLLAVAAAPAPSLVIEEVVTVVAATGVGRLARVPGYIITIAATVGGTTGNLRIIPVGETPATTQVAVNFVTGGLVCAAADLVTEVKVSYIPLGVGPFIEANRVVDESNAGANDTTRVLANRAALIQYIWNDTAGTLPTFVPDGEAPGTGECAVDMENSGTTIITVNAAQDDATFKITYWKFSAIGLAFGWTDSTDLTVTSNAVVLPELTGIWIPGFGNVIVGEATTTNKQAILAGPSGAAAANVGKYDLPKPSVVFDNGDAITTISVPWIVLDPAQIAGNVGQVPAGTNLAAVTVRIKFEGR